MQDNAADGSCSRSKSGTLSFETKPSTPRAYMAKISDGELTGYGLGPDLGLSSGEDWIVEAGVVGNQLSMKIWRDGGPVPTTPQLMEVDPTPLPDGQLGVASWVGTAHSSSFPIDATFDDIWFTQIPEPATILLAIFGMTSVCCWRRRR